MKFRFLTAAIVLFVSFGFLTFIFSPRAAQASATHIVISEIQLAGGTTNDEFIELYNPTATSVSLSNWKLTKKTSTGTESDLVATMSGTIASHGYFLIARPEYDGVVTPDSIYSGNIIANDNTVLLYNSALTVIDKVGLGAATDKETTTIANPTANHSVERKANSASTIASMTTGIDMFAGNGEDTDNNNADFITRTVSDPQNSSSALEPIVLTPTPTNSPTPTLTNSPTPTSSPTPTETPTMTPSATPTVTPSPTSIPSPTPTITPSPTLTPTPIPTATPTFTPTPTVTFTPTPTPTVTPTPTLTLTPTQSPTPTVTSTPVPTFSLTPTPSIGLIPTATLTPTILLTMSPTPTEKTHRFHFPIVCSWKFNTIRIHGFTLRIPVPHCEREERHRR